MQPKIAILGAGAIGGYLAAALSRSGTSAGIVARGEHLEAIRAGGLRVSAEDGEFVASLAASGDLREFDNLEYVLVTLKSHQWQAVLPQLEPSVRSGAAIVTLQNGLPFWYDRNETLHSVDPGGAIRAAVPYDCVIGGVVHTSGHIVSPGHIHQSGSRLYPLGEPDGSMSDRLARLSRLFESAGLHAPVEADIRRIVWRKLLGNLALNPVSALTRATVRAMLDDPMIRPLLRSIIEEGLAVARADGIDIGVTAEERLNMAAHIADVKTSMLQDLESGKPLELEPICGAVLEIAQRHKVPVPNIASMYALTALLDRVSRAAW